MWSMAITENYDKNQSHWRLMDHFICFSSDIFRCWRHLNACIVSQMDISHWLMEMGDEKKVNEAEGVQKCHF